VTRERDSIAEPTLAERSHRRSAAKSAIARRALEIIGERFRGSVYLDAGTTTQAVATQLAELLSGAGGKVEIVTHAMTLAHTLAGASDADLTVIGGRVRTATGSGCRRRHGARDRAPAGPTSRSSARTASRHPSASAHLIQTKPPSSRRSSAQRAASSWSPTPTSWAASCSSVSRRSRPSMFS
jgi:nucleotide-binding universal stress UspA family protein